MARLKEWSLWNLGWLVWPIFKLACRDAEALRGTRHWLHSKPDRNNRLAAHTKIGDAL